MSVTTLTDVINSIQIQLPDDPSEIKGSFVVDQKAAEVARNQFNHHYNVNWGHSTWSSVAGAVSFIGFACSIPALFFALVPAISAIGVGIIFGRLWVTNRNREGYILQEALFAESEEAAIQKLSQGANIYQLVWPCGGAAPDLLPLRKGGPRTVMEWFAEKGFTKVVAYLAMLEPDLEKRSQMATQALLSSKDKKTAQLLVDLGGSIQEQMMLPFSCGRDLELLSFFAENDAVFDAGINDYEKWNADVEKRKREFGGNWYPGNNEGVNPNLHPCFTTPLEWLLCIDAGHSGRFKNPSVYLKAMHIDPSVYQSKSSADDLYHSLNQAGVRIRRENAVDLFERLHGQGSSL